MSKKLYLSSVLLAIMVGVAVVYFQLVDDAENVQTSTDAAVMPVKRALAELEQRPGFHKLPVEDRVELISSVLDKLPPEYATLRHQYKVALSPLPDIEFHGRVIDQHNMPVSGAQVRFAGTNSFLSSGSGQATVYTDKQGYFSLSARGRSLVLSGVVHPDIEYSFPQMNTDGDISVLRGRLRKEIGFASVDDDPYYEDLRKYFDKSNAFVVKVWRLGEYEGAIGADYDLGIKSDGSVSTIRFSNKWNARQKFDGESDGHIRVSCVRAEMSHENDYSDWTVTVAPVNGGIQETDDVYMNVAPVSGYQPSLVIKMRLADKNYKPKVLNKRYYFTSNNGNEYGGLLMHIEPHAQWMQDEQQCVIRMSYKINPAGSRNLELKKNSTTRLLKSTGIQTAIR